MSYLELEHLTVDFNGFIAVNDVNLSIREKETRVIIGPNGAGKTTLIDMITGKTAPTSGRILFKGEQISGRDPYLIARKFKVGRKFQGPNVFDYMSVYENIEVALSGFTSILGSFAYRRTPSISAEIGDILEKIKLAEKKDLMTVSLSHGERQWLEIGMVLAQKPEIITLDEPTAGMTAQETWKTGEMIQTLMKDKTVIVIEHDIDFVRQIAQTITVLHQGQVLAEGTYDEITNNPEVVRVYLKSEEPQHAVS